MSMVGATLGDLSMVARATNRAIVERTMELGLATFADLPAGVSPQQRMKDLLEEAKLADELGLDVFAIGEHHRPDFLISSTTVALGAAPAITDNIRLSRA